MPQTDGDKLKAFVQKMHNEGAAGFAAGPWSLGSGGDATGAASRSNYHSRPSRTRRLGTPGRRLADRLLSGLAMLSIAAIIVGIGGIYLTEEPGQLHVAGSDSGRVQTALRQPDEKQLREIKQKLLLTSNRLDSLAAEFRRLKRHANTATAATAADEQRLQVLENRLLLTVTRLDTLSAEILDLKQVNNMILAATTTAPPAAPARETGTPARSTVRAMPPAQATPAALFGPGKLHPAEAPMATPIPAASPTPEPQTVAAASPEPEKVAAASPAPEPQPEPQTVAATSPEPQPEPQTVAATSPAPEPQPEPQTAAATSPAPEPQPEPQTAAATSPEPEKVAATSPAPGTSSSPTTGNAGGDWVVNIASYSRQKTANRHVAELQQSGISAERVEAMVDGRRIHRVRVAGLASRSAARARAGALKQELDLPGIWIGKR